MESSVNDEASGETEAARAATDGLQAEIERVRENDVESLAAETKQLAAEARPIVDSIIANFSTRQDAQPVAAMP